MPPVVLERPKMSRVMWESLKSHIMRERQRKQQELEADAEVERQRKERERQQKQDSMTLSETRDQVVKLDASLAELKEEKHQLFLQLKKVLNEDETRRRQLINKEASEMMSMNYLGQPGPPTGGQSAQMFLQPITLQRPPSSYKVGPVPQHVQAHNQHTLLPPGTLKRSRSPSPPPHNYKFGPFKPPPHALHSYPHKPTMGLQYFHPPSSQPPVPQQQQQQQQQHQQHSAVTYSHPTGQPPALYTYSGGPGPGHSGPSPTRSPQTNREEPQKHIQQGHGGYVQQSQPIGRGYAMLHHPMEHGPQQSKFVEESPKYYPPPSSHQTPINLLRPTTHMNLHPGLTIQQQQVVPSGNINSGSYPIRAAPTVSAYQGRPPSPQIVYAGQTGPPRLNYNHPHGQPSGSPHGQVQHQAVSVTRYSMPPVMTRDRDRDRD